jgi:hypothetical protein
LWAFAIFVIAFFLYVRVPIEPSQRALGWPFVVSIERAEWADSKSKTTDLTTIPSSLSNADGVQNPLQSELILSVVERNRQIPQQRAHVRAQLKNRPDFT